MKKLLVVLLVVAMVVGCVAVFAGCSPSNDDFKVGAIYITSQNDTAGYTYAHHNGITSAMKQLGLSKDQLLVVDNVAEEKDKVMAAVDTLAGKGCKMIIGISFGYIEAFAEAAEKAEYSDIIFSHATGYKSNETNFNNYFGRIYQARYLAGIAAGLKAKQGAKIGYVAAWGTEYAETCSGINSFALGVQSVNPTAEVLVKKISTWGNESLEKSAAEALVAQGCEVIAQHCDSAQPQIVAQDKGVFGCGYNSDMTEQAPKAHLTAPIWHWDVYYKLAIQTAMNSPKEFMSKVGIYYGGLKEGFVDISPLSSNCAEGTKEKIEAVKAKIIAGEWDVFQNRAITFDGNNVVIADKAILKADGTPAGEINDGVIKSSMNYYVKGVREV